MQRSIRSAVWGASKKNNALVVTLNTDDYKERSPSHARKQAKLKEIEKIRKEIDNKHDAFVDAICNYLIELEKVHQTSIEESTKREIAEKVYGSLDKIYGIFPIT